VKRNSTHRHSKSNYYSVMARPEAPRRAGFRLPRLTVVIGLLVLTLGVATALAWQAHQAALSHQAVAERVQRDYVSFAGLEFARAARLELGSRLERWLDVIGCSASKGELPEPSRLGACGGCRCDDLKARSLFVVDVASGEVTTTGEKLGPNAASLISDLGAARIRIPQQRPSYLLRVGMLDGAARALAAGYVRDRFGAPTKIAGFVAAVDVLTPAFDHILKHRPLLPPTLAGERNDLLNLSVHARDDISVFESTPSTTPGPPSTIVVDANLDETFDRLKYTLSLKPEAAERLVIGGLPRSRLPLLIGLLALTAGLLAVAIQQLRREHDLSRLRADFVASVSHELRTPLAQIRLFSETLLLGRVRSEDEGRRSLEIIQQESRRLSHLVENVLYFARAEHNAQRLAATDTHLAPFVAEIIDAFAPLARSGRATVRLDVSTDVTAAIDRSAFRQVLLNLLDNAVKYGRPDQVIVVGIDGREGRATLTVDDQGPGVPADARAKIWLPYSRLGSTATSAVAGTGIGLAVVRELVALHGGSTRVEDAPHGGARFVVELPNASIASDADAPAPAPSRATA
jgi:signal transduction histidine kinase